MPSRKLPAFLLPTQIGSPPHTRFLYALLQALRNMLGGVAERLDSGPFNVVSYTLAERPPPADFPSAIIFVSDAPAGQMLQYSDGTAWVPAG